MAEDKTPKPGAADEAETEAHTELRRRDAEGQGPAAQDDEVAPQPRPRTPLDRVPDEGDEDDLFNDMPV